MVQFTPTLTAANAPNTPGSSVLLAGQGYAPGETVNFSINGTNGGQAVADSSGNFTGASFTIPNLSVGTYQLHGVGASSGADGLDYFYVGGFYPLASPSTYYLLPGQTLGFNGSGFAPGETVRFTATATPLASFTVGSSGSFTNAGQIIIPNSLSGGVRIFTLTSSQTDASIPVMVTVGVFNGIITPSSFYVIPGQVLNFSGQGFAPNETVQITVAGNTTPAATFNADAQGTFTNAGNITIPFSDAGTTKQYTVTGLSSGTSAGVDITAQGFFPQITPSAYYVAPGQEFTVAGNGFAPGEVVQLVMNGGSPVSTTTNSSGAFAAAGPFTAPYSGTIQVVATGNSSGVSNSVDVTLGGLYPSLTPSSYYITPGIPLLFRAAVLRAEKVSVSPSHPAPLVV